MIILIKIRNQKPEQSHTNQLTNIKINSIQLLLPLLILSFCFIPVVVVVVHFIVFYSMIICCNVKIPIIFNGDNHYMVNQIIISIKIKMI